MLAVPGTRNKLAQSVVNLGVIYWKERDYPQAEKSFRKAEELLLAPGGKGGHAAAREASIALGQIAVNWVGVLWELKKPEQAVARADAAIERLEGYRRIEPNDQVARDLCLKLHGNRGQALAALGKYREAAADWGKVVELSGDPVPAFHRIVLAMTLLKAGEPDQAVAQARLARESKAQTGEDLYNIGCFFCRAAVALKSDERGSSDERRSQQIESFLAEALAALQKAAATGFFRDPAMREQAQKDTDLDILRDRAEFRRLVGANPPG